jgi:hypothetical protein
MPGLSVQVEYTAMIWDTSILEARSLGTGGVYRDDKEVRALQARSFDTGRVYCTVIENEGVRFPVFRYSCSI